MKFILKASRSHWGFSVDQAESGVAGECEGTSSRVRDVRLKSGNRQVVRVPAKVESEASREREIFTRQ